MNACPWRAEHAWQLIGGTLALRGRIILECASKREPERAEASTNDPAEDYDILLTVMDEHGLSSELEFPVHLVGWTLMSTPGDFQATNLCISSEPTPPADFPLPAE